MAGQPLTVASARQEPSPRRLVPANDFSRDGGAHCALSAAALRAALLDVAALAWRANLAALGPVGMVAFPPTFGGW
jgi:hypothetical protein